MYIHIYICSYLFIHTYIRVNIYVYMYIIHLQERALKDCPLIIEQHKCRGCTCVLVGRIIRAE